ncbi:mitotic-spindle organizing protein 2 isoform X2 [Dunckerocampus dactyliophorus]|uniref:mitotic-spindle organizing protein 2 isoform X2 n=1 Tax=Dunckerocampus dactyliophorus TaxID=161453 RepID=UPI0024050026|nr:mitotic-spindle organizing protein 2 isoform X2 [Dunckerocampus dactyliophorus]
MSQPAGSSAPDSATLVVTTNVHQYSMKKKKVLNAEESELFELTQAAGISVDQEVFKIIVDLLKMNVAPQAVFETLKAMSAGQRVPESSSSGDSATSSHGTGIPSATAETRDECLVSGKSPKLPAAPSSTSGPRAARVSTKIVVYGPQDVNAPHSQVRSKASAAPSSSTSHGEKSREASGQRVQRQPSATRGQKTKSSGSSSSSSQLNST